MNKTQTAEQTFTQMAAAIAPNPEIPSQSDEPVIMLKKIGSTIYEVAVHFSTTSKETIGDKITRLIRNEAENGKAAGQ